MKTCASCGLEKPLDAFYRDSRYLDNPPRGSCKECILKRQRTPKKRIQPVPKECSVCGVVKPPHEFVKEPRHADGLRSECKECFYTPERYAKDQEWRHANPDRIRSYNNKPQWQAMRLQWRKDNPEKAAAILRRSRAKQRAKDPDGFRTKVQLMTQRRRARKKANGGDLTRQQWETIKATYGHRCAYCGKPQKRLTMDHVVPLVKGGKHTASNVVPACRWCNSKKHDKPAPTHQMHLIT